jgi:hypothetical protein
MLLPPHRANKQKSLKHIPQLLFPQLFLGLLRHFLQLSDTVIQLIHNPDKLGLVRIPNLLDLLLIGFPGLLADFVDDCRIVLFH